MSRSRLFDKLRRLDQGDEAPPLPAAIPEFPGYDDPVSRFAQELNAVGGRFLDGRGKGQLESRLSEVLHECGVTEVFWECDPLLFEEHAIPHRVRDPIAFQSMYLLSSHHHNHSMKLPLVLHSKPYRRRDVAGVKLSVGRAAWGIAETGTVALQVEPSKGRLLSMLPPAHVALLSERKLLMNAAEFFQKFRPGDKGSLLTLVTGPSRTADIEKTLVIGVHGPGRWYVALTA